MDTLRAIVCFFCILPYFIENNDAAHILRKRLVGGRNPTSDEAKPYVAFVSGNNLCGGAIIDEKFILTSAQCVRSNASTGKLPYRTFVIAGVPDLNGYKRKRDLIFDVAKAYIPSSYRITENYINLDDVAILELKKNLRLEENSDKMKKLKLPQPIDGTHSNYENAVVMVGGFGNKYLNKSKYENGDDKFLPWSPYQLQVGKSEVIDNKRCQMQGYGNNVNGNHICVRVTETLRHAGPCRGDYGSPLILANEIVIGVLSNFDESCDTDAYPALYMDISCYLGFIENVKSGNITNIISYEA